MPKRCDVCHQSDLFDPKSNHCERCKNLEPNIDKQVNNEKIIDISVRKRIGMSVGLIHSAFIYRFALTHQLLQELSVTFAIDFLGEKTIYLFIVLVVLICLLAGRKIGELLPNLSIKNWLTIIICSSVAYLCVSLVHYLMKKDLFLEIVGALIGISFGFIISFLIYKCDIRARTREAAMRPNKE